MTLPTQRREVAGKPSHKQEGKLWSKHFRMTLWFTIKKVLKSLLRLSGKHSQILLPKLCFAGEDFSLTPPPNLEEVWGKTKEGVERADLTGKSGWGCG